MNINEYEPKFLFLLLNEQYEQMSRFHLCRECSFTFIDVCLLKFIMLI